MKDLTCNDCGKTVGTCSCVTHIPSARQEAERIVHEANTEYQQECVTTTYRDDEKLVTLIAASLHAAEQRGREPLKEIAELLPGWREVVAEIDDLPKSEVLGKAMWATLNQMDDMKKRLDTALREGT